MRDPYSHFVDLALSGIEYDRSSDGTLHAQIPGFYGLAAQGKSKAECVQQLRSKLRDWLTYRHEHELPIPAVGGFRIATLDFALQGEKLNRLHRIEHEMQLLKMDLDENFDGGKLLGGYAKRGMDWYKSYWQFVVTLSSVLILIIAYTKYGVDPIQNYREIGDKIRMADRYVEIGDQLLLRSGSLSPDAERAYQIALDLYPANIRARYGLLKSQILNPEKGKDDYDIATAQTKVSSARVYMGDDYYLSYVEGLIAMRQAEAAGSADKNAFGEKARRSFLRSQELEPDFNGNYLGLALHDIYFLKPSSALQILKDAYQRNHRSPSILTYLGSLHGSYRQFNEAVQYLTESNTLATRLETLLVLGDMYRNASDCDPSATETFLNAAIARHKSALEMAEQTNLVRGNDYDDFYYHSMPTGPGKPQDGDISPASLTTINDFKVLINYSLSFDYLLINNQKEANLAFNSALALDKMPTSNARKYSCWYENQANYLINQRPTLAAAGREWLQANKSKAPCPRGGGSK